MEIPQFYGYVVFVVLASFLVNLWLAERVSLARFRYNIQTATTGALSDGGGETYLKAIANEVGRGRILLWVGKNLTLKIVWHDLAVGAVGLFCTQYPAMYSQTNNVFNCMQRSHLNFVENYPSFLALLLLAGLTDPVKSSKYGLVWLAGRVVYAIGYSTGEPWKRLFGSFQYIGLAGLLYHTYLLGIQLL